MSKYYFSNASLFRGGSNFNSFLLVRWHYNNIFCIPAPSKPKEDWSVSSSGNTNWGDPRREPGGAIGSRIPNDANPVGRPEQANWNPSAPGVRPNGPGASGPNWVNSSVPPPPSRGSGWDHDSPPISRRGEDNGTGYWGRSEKPPGAPGAPPMGGLGGNYCLLICQLINGRGYRAGGKRLLYLSICPEY